MIENKPTKEVKKDKYDVAKLNEMYTDADSADATMFSEMRSNVLLVSSEHFRKTSESYYSRDTSSYNGLSEQQRPKIKITKNHTARIMQKIEDGIASLSPGLKVHPALENELSCKKSAELYDSVLDYGKERYNLADKREEWLRSFVNMGECATKVLWYKNRGDIVGYNQLVHEESDAPLFLDANGEITDQQQNIQLQPHPVTGEPVPTPIGENKPAPDMNKPVYSGDFVFETIHPFNLLRDPSAESMEESPYLIVRKMIERDEVLSMLDENDPDYKKKKSFVEASAEQTYKVFNTTKGTYDDERGKVMMKEIYFRPSYEFPKGCYKHFTSEGILFEGSELPYGVFPIAWRAFDKVPTHARGRSKIKIIRPLQYEANRLSSAQVETQIVHGMDKIITPPGIKMSQGANLSAKGIQHFTAAGTPIVIPGRTGDQFTAPYQATIAEMYQIVDEDSGMADAPAQLDPYSMLFRSAQRKQKYGKYATSFQAFLKDVYWIYLRLAKNYFDENRYIRSVGANEAINFAEFKNAKELDVQIKLVEQAEDSDSMMSKAMYLQYALQYVGKSLPPEALGNVLSNLPFANSAQIFKPLLLDTKNAENDMLAMDRGEPRQAAPNDNHDFNIKALTNRMKSPDFKLLGPQIQQMYAAKLQQHQQIMAQQQQQIQMAEQGQIPQTGVMSKCDVYTMVDGKQSRLMLPTDALMWVNDKLTQQGLSQQRMHGLSLGDQASIAQMQMQQAQQQQGQPPQQQAPQHQPMPQGVR
jgi:hypothetical protein